MSGKQIKRLADAGLNAEQIKLVAAMIAEVEDFYMDTIESYRKKKDE